MLYPYKTHLIVYACVVMYIPMCSNIVLVLKVKILVHVKMRRFMKTYIAIYVCMWKALKFTNNLISTKSEHKSLVNSGLRLYEYISECGIIFKQVLARQRIYPARHTAS